MRDDIRNKKNFLAFFFQNSISDNNFVLFKIWLFYIIYSRHNYLFYVLFIIIFECYLLGFLLIYTFLHNIYIMTFKSIISFHFLRSTSLGVAEHFCCDIWYSLEASEIFGVLTASDFRAWKHLRSKILPFLDSCKQITKT